MSRGRGRPRTELNFDSSYNLDIRRKADRFDTFSLGMCTRYGQYLSMLMFGGMLASEDLDQIQADWNYLTHYEKDMFECLGWSCEAVVARYAPLVNTVGYNGDTMFYHDAPPPAGTIRHSRYMEKEALRHKTCQTSSYGCAACIHAHSVSVLKKQKN